MARGGEAKLAYSLPTRDAELRYLERLRAEIEAKAELYSPLGGVVAGDPAKRVSKALHAWKDDPDLDLVLRYRPRPRKEETEAVQHDYDNVLDAFGEAKQAALLGEPGFGKSTTLSKLALDLAKRPSKTPLRRCRWWSASMRFPRASVGRKPVIGCNSRKSGLMTRP